MNGNGSGRSRTVPAASEAIDLTGLEDSGEDSDCQFVTSVPRPPKGGPKKKTHGAIDLRSPSPPSGPAPSKSSQPKRAHDNVPPLRNKTIARKSASTPLSGGQTTPGAQPRPNADGLPDLPRSAREPSKASKQPQSKSTAPALGTSDTLKRPRNPSSPVDVRSPKRAKHNAPAAAPTKRSEPTAASPSRMSNGIPRSNSDVARVPKDQARRQPSSPSRSQVPKDGGPSQRATEGTHPVKRSVAQTGQETSPRSKSSARAPSQTKETDKEQKRVIRSSPPITKHSKSALQGRTNSNSDERAGRSSPAERPSAARPNTIQTDEKSSRPSRALSLLDERLELGQGKKKRLSLSDEDQGYASLGSGSSVDHAQNKAGPAPKTSAPVQRPREKEEGGGAGDVLANQAEPHTRGNDPLANSRPEKTQGNHKASDGVSLPEEEDKSTAADTPNRKRDAAEKRLDNSAEAPEIDDFQADNEAAAAAADDQLQSEAMRAESASMFAMPQSAASALKSTAAYNKLSLVKKVETTLGQYMEELAQDNEYWTGDDLMRARLSKETNPMPEAEPVGEPTSFAHMKPITAVPAPKNDARARIWGVEKMAMVNSHNSKPVSSEKLFVARQTFSTKAHDVPSYSHYISITKNILSRNNKTLHCWPYFGDNFDCHKDASNLKEQYHLDMDDRERKLLRLCQAQKHEEYVESALEDLELSWSDVLRFLLEDRPAVGSEPGANRALLNRQDFCKEDFNRQTTRWVTVLSSLPPSTPEKLARAAVLCENFQKMARFPLWHVARRSDICKLPDKTLPLEDATIASDELTCRICMRFNCPYHGEISERPDDEEDDDESETSGASVVATDLVHPPNINYRTRIVFPDVDPIDKQAPDPVVKPARKDFRYWQNYQNKSDKRGPFYPCAHPGMSCDDEKADCRCLAENVPCEKFCGCNKDCDRRFQGCSCSTDRVRSGKRGPCFEDERCACWQLGRECDPDLCGECGVCEVIDPVNRHDEEITHRRCQNASIQRAMPKCTLLGDSGIHGLGLYACENIRQHEFVGEYKGEIITREEAERRGAVYEHQKLSYLFSLNKDQEIDSTYFGNKIRFINHASSGRDNLYPRIIMVNTVHRIALYAQRFIKKGEELLFNYGPKFPDEQLGGSHATQSQSKKSAPHVRNANLVREFAEVEEDEDELGNVRARAVPFGQKAKKSKPRGRPKGRKPPTALDEPQGSVNEGENDEGSPFQDDVRDRDAGERLAAYNVADDRASDLGDLQFDERFRPEDEEDEEYQETDDEAEIGASEDTDELSEDPAAEEDGILRRGRGRPSKKTRFVR